MHDLLVDVRGLIDEATCLKRGVGCGSFSGELFLWVDCCSDFFVMVRVLMVVWGDQDRFMCQTFAAFEYPYFEERLLPEPLRTVYNRRKSASFVVLKSES